MEPILHSGPGILIGIPTLGRPVSLDWALALKSMNTPINYNVNFHLVKGAAVDHARNQIAQFALAKNAKYLFFLGDDVVCPSHTIKQLVYRAEQDPSIGIIGGVYCSKCDPPAPLVFRGNGAGSYWDWKIGECFEVTGLGLDCNLIRTDVFKQLPYNGGWFKTVDKEQYADGVNNAETWTEDLYFYKRVREETNFKIFCDASIICEHEDVYKGRKYTLPPDSLPMRRKLVKKADKKALMVGVPIPIQDSEKEEFDIINASSQEDADYRTQGGMLPFDNEYFDWVIVNNPGLSVDIEEYRRVIKPSGKITIKFNPLLDENKLLSIIPNSVKNGQFIEVSK